MHDQMALYLRGAFVSNAINSRHTLTVPSPLAFHHPLENALYDVLSSSMSGVMVHWGACGSGKSTAVQHACYRLQTTGRLVVLLQGYDFSTVTSFHAWIRCGVGVPDADQQTVSAFFNRPATIVIDHFDLLMHRKCDKAVLDFLSDLMDESVRTNKFNVLLVVSSWERAIQLRDAGRCTVVGSPSRWTEEELKTVFCTPIPKWNAATKSTLFQLSVLAGSPGYLALALAGKECLFHGHAMEIDLEWRKGTAALVYGDWTLGVGRFPDIDGVFHECDYV
jgi:hypothetical protein